MRTGIADNFAALVHQGKRVIGELLIQTVKEGFEICHREEENCSELQKFYGAPAARLIAIYDDAGKYRPLKTAPNLKHGWRLVLANAGELRLALDYLYPAQAGMLQSDSRGELQVVSLRETLSRQTGMYRVTRLLTDEQAEDLVAGHCRSCGGCLRKILWPMSEGQPLQSLPPEKTDSGAVAPDEIPLLCVEACNLLVAAARTIAKKNLPKSL